jgi:hypothetical protein
MPAILTYFDGNGIEDQQVLKLRGSGWLPGTTFVAIANVPEPRSGTLALLSLAAMAVMALAVRRCKSCAPQRLKQLKHPAATPALLSGDNRVKTTCRSVQSEVVVAEPLNHCAGQLVPVAPLLEYSHQSQKALWAAVETEVCVTSKAMKQ